MWIFDYFSSISFFHALSIMAKPKEGYPDVYLAIFILILGGIPLYNKKVNYEDKKY